MFYYEREACLHGVWHTASTLVSESCHFFSQSTVFVAEQLLGIRQEAGAGEENARGPVWGGKSAPVPNKIELHQMLRMDRNCGGKQSREGDRSDI